MNNPQWADDACWRAANEYVAILQPIIPVLPTCIRLLRKNYEDSASSVAKNTDRNARILAEQIMSSPFIKIPFYYAGLSFHRNQLEQSPMVSEKMLIQLFTPHEVASMLTMLYLFQRIRRITTPKTFSTVTPSIHRSVDLGMCVGRALQEIGGATGVLMGGLRLLAFGMFMIVDDKLFLDYWEHLRQQNLAHDLRIERERWGCTHAHIGSLLLLALGFGTSYAHSYFLGVSAKVDRKENREAFNMNVIRVWIETLLVTGMPPESNIGDEFELEGSTDELSSKVNNILKRSKAGGWLEKKVQDLSGDIKVKLFAGPIPQQTATYNNLPTEVKTVFTVEEWKEFHAGINELVVS